MSAVKNVIKDNYNTMLLKDFLREKIKDAGFSRVDISKNPMGTRVTLHVTRPGIVIGRKGTGIRELTERLENDFGLKNTQISVVEIDKPELSPSVMCNRMASHLERGTAFRRATMWTLQQVMGNGALGVQITISGKLRGDRSAFEKHTAGVLPRAGAHADRIVSEDVVHVKTPMGLIGIRIRIALKEKVVPEFEFRKPYAKKTDKVDTAGKTQEDTKENKTDNTNKDDKTGKKPDGNIKDDKTGKKPENDIKEHKIKDDKTGEMRDETAEEHKARTETEQIAIDAEKMKDLETLEEEEAKLSNV